MSESSGQTGSALDVRNLEVGYGKTASAVEGISMHVESGAFTAVLGANGAGKTTIVRAITGMLGLHTGSVRSGNITIDGRDVTNTSARERVLAGVCHVPEGRMVFSRLDIEENLRLGAATRNSRREIDADVETMMELFPSLARRRGSKAGLLSGGEQQMLAIARALMARPSVLIIDELSLGLAPLVVTSIFAHVEAVNKRGVTVIVIEQNARLALKYADYAYVLQAGRVVAEGTSSALGSDSRLSELYLGGTVDEEALGDATEARVATLHGRIFP
jgi:branched-chain amino acid transport system ATP-binding protein